MNKKELKNLKTFFENERVTIIIASHVKRLARKKLKELNFVHYLHTGKFL